jgi:uncharacterized RDD family membrane protein YckC
MDEILDEKTYETRTVVYASFTLRATAFLIDVFLFVIVSYGLYYVLKSAPTYAAFLQMFCWKITVVIMIYFIYFDGSEKNATPGKQIMNIRLLNEKKREIDYNASAKHLLFSTLLFFGFFRLLLNDKQQTLADKICKVVVVKVK